MLIGMVLRLNDPGSGSTCVGTNVRGTAGTYFFRRVSTHTP
jgi:hypothetical protein